MPDFLPFAFWLILLAVALFYGLLLWAWVKFDEWRWK